MEESLTDSRFEARKDLALRQSPRDMPLSLEQDAPCSRRYSVFIGFVHSFTAQIVLYLSLLVYLTVVLVRAKALFCTPVPCRR